MKSTLHSFVLTALFMLLCQSLSAQEFNVDGICYKIKSKDQLTVEVTSGNCYGNVSIPSSVTYSGVTYSITSIGPEAFFGCTGLTSITMPNCVTSIAYGAFSGCDGLTSITIPNSLTSIEQQTFYGCSGLTSITIPSSVTSIKEWAFSRCTGLISIIIPNSVTNIGNEAFYGCTNLQYNEYDSGLYLGNEANPYFALITSKSKNITNINICANCVHILDAAFSGCSKLTNLTIPSSVTNINSRAFFDCKLREIQVLGETPANIFEKSFSEQSKYHATVLVPYGCFEDYAYADSYWYAFVHIKENAGKKQNISPKQAYGLKNAKTRSYIVYDAVNDAVRNIDLDVNIDEDNANHNWQVVEANGNTYIYNIGAKKYLYTEGADTQLKLSTTPVAISMSDGDSGIKLDNAGEWLFILNNQLAVDESVSDIEQLAIETKSEENTPTYTLLGTKVQTAQQNGLYVHNGKKVMTK